MIHTAVLKLEVALLEAGATGASREELVRAADIGTTTFYRVIKPLVESGRVVEQGNRYILPMTRLYNFRFKLWHDMERLYRLDETDRNDVLHIRDQALAHLGDNLHCLWLVGSGAACTLGPDSDLDFLAVVKTENDYHPVSARNLQFVPMTLQEFRQAYAERDEFVLEALESGVLLHDLNFAQPFYEQSVSLKGAVSESERRQQKFEAFRNKVLFFVEHDAMDDARKALSSLAVEAARFMLGAMEMLPRSKVEIVPLCVTCLGPGISECIDAILKDRHRTKKGILSASRELTEYHYRFRAHLGHLAEWANLPRGGSELGGRLPALFREFFPHALLDTEESRETGSRSAAELKIESSDGQRLRVFFKALRSGLQAGHLEALTAYSGTEKSGLVLMANVYRDLPAAKRPPFPRNLEDLACALGIRLLTGLEVLRAHNILHLEKRSPQEVRRDTLQLPW